MNNVQLVGELAADPEIRSTSTGKTVTNFRVATKRGEYTDYHACVAWEKTADSMAGLAKGDVVAVQGYLRTRSWEDRDGNKRYTTEVNAFTVEWPCGNRVGSIAEGDPGDDCPF